MLCEIQNEHDYEMEVRKEQVWAVLKYCVGVCLEVLMKTKGILSQNIQYPNLDSKSELPK
jgi:hypothetical protein